jgi:hypothetical protein
MGVSLFFKVAVSPYQRICIGVSVQPSLPQPEEEEVVVDSGPSAS